MFDNANAKQSGKITLSQWEINAKCLYQGQNDLFSVLEPNREPATFGSPSLRSVPNELRCRRFVPAFRGKREERPEFHCSLLFVFFNYHCKCLLTISSTSCDNFHEVQNYRRADCNFSFALVFYSLNLEQNLCLLKAKKTISMTLNFFDDEFHSAQLNRIQPEIPC